MNRLFGAAALLLLACSVSVSQNLAPGIQTINVAAVDMVWDSSRSVYWVATAGTDPLYPASILSIDPTSAQVTDQISPGAIVAHLALSADGQYLFAADTVNSVLRYPLPSHTPDLQISLGSDNRGPLFATALAPLPGVSGSFAASLVDSNENNFVDTATIVVFDGATPRAESAAAPKDALFAVSSSQLTAWGAQVAVSLNVSAAGVTFSSAVAGFPVGGARAFNSGRYVTDDWGYVFDTAAARVIGRAAGILRCFSAIDQAGASVLALSTNTGETGPVMTQYSLTTFRPAASFTLASLPTTGLSGALLLADNSGSMSIWGSDGVAINVGSSLLFLHLSSLQPVAVPATSPTADPSGAIRIPIQSGGLAYDASRNLLMASVPGASAGPLGNTLIQINPASGVISNSIFAGSEPGAIALTSDNARAVVSLGGAPLVVPVNLNSNSAEPPFSVLDPVPQFLTSDTFAGYQYWSPGDLVALSDNSQGVALLRTTGVQAARSIVAYDVGVPRPQIVSADYLADRLYPGDAPNALFSLDLQDTSFTINRLLVSSNGVALDRQLTPIVGTFNGTFAYASGKYYSSDGTIWSGSEPSLIGTVAATGVPVPFPDQNLVVYLSQSPGAIAVNLFSVSTYTLLSSTLITRDTDPILSAVRTGTGSFAFRTSTEIVLMSLSSLPNPPVTPMPTLQTIVPGVSKIALVANAITLAPGGTSILAATSSTAGTYGNSIVTIDPATAHIQSIGYAGSEPVALTVVPGSNTVYTSLSGEAGLGVFNLATNTRQLEFSVDPTNSGGQYYPWDLLAQADGSVAVSFYDGSIAVFDSSGNLKPGVDLNNQSFAEFGARYQLAFSPSGGKLYGYDQWASSFGLRRDNVSATGLQGLSLSPGLIDGFGTEIRASGSLLYSSVGDIVDPERSRVIGRFLDPALQQPSGSKHVWPDPASDHVYFIAGSQILVFDIHTFAEVGSLQLPYYDGDATALVKVASNLVFLTSTGDLWVVAIASIPSIPQPVAPPPLLLPYTPGVGVIDLTVNDLAYDSAKALLYATVPNSQGAQGDSVVSFDPTNGIITTATPDGPNPHLVRISQDGTTAFVSMGFVNNSSLYVGEGISTIPVTTNVAGPEWGTVPPIGGYIYSVADMLPLPGQPGSIAVVNNFSGEGSVRIYDGTVQRPNALTNGYVCTSIQPAADPSRLYCYNGYTSDLTFFQLTLDANGVTIFNSSGPDLIGAFNATILYDGGRVYSSNGHVIDPEALTLLATLPVSGSSVAADGGNVYWLSAGPQVQNTTATITTFDEKTLDRR